MTVDWQEYKARRQKLAQSMSPDSVAIIPAANELLRNGDAHYRFRQDSNFYYLTGFNEPEALLMVIAGEEGDSYLFNRKRNPALEQWTGRRLGQEDAPSLLGVREAFPIETLAQRLPEFLTAKTKIYYTIGHNQACEQLVFQAMQHMKTQIRRGVVAPDAIQDIEPLIGEMRLFKSVAELNLMRMAAKISVSAHERAMRACRSLKNEHELEAELIYEFSRHGCRSVAYDPIVGVGANACVLHYTDNNQALTRGELVLIDAGGEFENYAADITRTFPVNGRFSPEQRAIYQLVLHAQQAAIACVKPGVRWVEIQKTILRILTAGLCELGILQGDVETLIANEAYKPFYMHNSGHWLGLDVHDSGAYKVNGEWRQLAENMVLTVEPGLYISADIPNVDPRWWNIGVRIEDDILVTATGHENLTGALAVEIDDIEALMRA